MNTRSIRKEKAVSRAKRRQGSEILFFLLSGSRICQDLPGCCAHCHVPLVIPLQTRNEISKSVKATRDCWNSSTCSRRLLVQCSSTAKVCCDKESTWQCPEERHSYKLKLCHDGSPTTCPGCQEDKVNGEMEAGGELLPHNWISRDCWGAKVLNSFVALCNVWTCL